MSYQGRSRKIAISETKTASPVSLYYGRQTAAAYPAQRQAYRRRARLIMHHRLQAASAAIIVRVAVAAALASRTPIMSARRRAADWPLAI